MRSHMWISTLLNFVIDHLIGQRFPATDIGSPSLTKMAPNPSINGGAFLFSYLEVSLTETLVHYVKHRARQNVP